MAEKKNYDVIVIGAGPGGLTAALYAARANLKVVILDRGIYGGQMNNTAGIDNYPISLPSGIYAGRSLKHLFCFWYCCS